MTEEVNDFSGSERFDIRRRVGVGGMGVVYEAWDRQNSMRVALKTLPNSDAARIYRFKQEFRNLTGLVHPHLATLYELFSVDESWFFTMEFVDGVNLIDYVRGVTLFSRPQDDSSSENEVTIARPDSAISPPPLPVAAHRNALRTEEQFDRLRATIRQLAGAISALHSSGKLHRDIKPSNVLVTPAGRTVLLDFGLTIGFSQEDDDRFVSGTVSYMAPEQAAGLPLTPAADWYAIGVMMYEALTGFLPFDGPPNHVMVQKQIADPPRPRLLASNLPEDLDQLCHALLTRDPSSRPSAAEVLRALGGEEPDRRTISSEEVPLIGRESHLAELTAAFNFVRQGKPLAMFVHGSSGEGKSFLVERFLQRLREEQGAVVLAGRCYEAESVPYKALDSLIDVMRQYLNRHPEIAEQVVPRDVAPLTRIFPVLADVPALASAPLRSGESSSAQELRGRASRALRDLLARLADRVPVVICIDDLQWGDLDSGMILSELLRAPDPPLLLLLGVYRSEGAGRSPILKLLLDAPVESGGAERRELALGLLSPEAARSLASGMLEVEGPRKEALASAIARESGGIPYFIHELVRFVGGGFELPENESLSLEQVLVHRFATLPAGARNLLEAIAVAGQPIRQRDAWEAADLSGEERGVLTLLRSELLVRSTGASDRDVVEPYHDRIRETLVSQLTPSRKKQHHRRLGDTLERSNGADAETLAVHFHHSDAVDKASHYYAAAASQAAEALAFDRAAKLYLQSLDLRSGSDPDRRPLRMALADALANAGRGAEAAREYEALVAGAAPSEGVELRRRAAYQYCVSGHLIEGRSAVKELLADHGVRLPEGPTAVIVALLRHRLRLWLRRYGFKRREESEIDPARLAQIDVVWSAAAGLSMNDIICGAGLQTYGLLLALSSGEIYRIARSMAWEATHMSNLGSKSWPKTVRLLDRAEELAAESGHPHAAGMATMARGIAEFTSGRWATAVPLLDEADAIFRARCTGVTWELDTAHAFALWGLIYMGEFGEMSRRTSLLLKEAEERGDRYASTTFGSFMQPHALLAADQPDAAREVLNRSREQWASGGFYLQDLCALMTDSLIDTYEGDGARGFDRYTANWKKVKASQLLQSQAIRMLTIHFRARAALAGAVNGRPELARAAAADAKRLAGEKIAWSVPYSRVLYAGVALIENRQDEAKRLLRESAAGFDAVNMRSHAESARLLLGELTGGSEGDALVREAEEWMASRGIVNARAMARLHIGAIA
jgi:eukaryotic-like serine/threonine-protein kinase